MLIVLTGFKSVDTEKFLSFSPIKKIASTVELNKTVSDSNPLTGETFFYTLQYRCASTVDDCIGTVITDPLPPEVEFIGVVGSPHTISEVYNAGTHTVTFTFQNILLAGSTGEVQVEVRYPNGVTPNGTVATNTATIDANNATPVSASIANTAFAEGALHLDKYTSTANALGGLSTYEFRVCNTRYSGNPTTEGKLNLSNIYIIDTLPAGAVLIQTHLAGGSVISYDPVTNIIEFSVTDLDVNECKYPRITVQYSDPPYGIDTLITNTGYAHATPLGENEIVEVDSYTHGFEAPYAEVEGWKDLSHSNLVQGAYGSYELDFEIMGTEQLDDFCIVDTIPAGVEITRLYHGGYYFSGLAGSSGNDIVTISYTTNLNPSQVITGSPFNMWLENDYFIDVQDDLGLTKGGGEYITSISWCFGDMPVGFGLYENILLDFQVRLDAPAGIATNCMEFTTSTTTPTPNFIEDCEDLNIIENTNGAITYAWKRALNVPPSGKYSPGDTVTFNLLAQNPSTAGDSLVNPEIFDLLPPELTYVPGSWQIPAWSQTFSTAPIFTETSNYNGTGRTLLSWSWTGASATNVPPDRETNIEFKAVIGENVSAGDDVFLNRYTLTGERVTDCWGYETPDINDLNNNGNTTELLCFDSVQFDIEGLISLESEKLVKGQMDSTYTKFPDVGNSVPGGISDYILEVRNLGNVAMDSVVIIDILPSSGDLGVIDTTGRDSRWRPNLVSTVAAPPGVTVFYSIEANPCRDDEGFVATGPVGCDVPNWSTIPPADLTTVQSLKFEFGNTLLQPQDTIQLAWAMRVPVNIFSTIGAQPDSIAWNSFGYIGRRTDNGQKILPSEPVKVGINVQNVVPNVYGDFVWNDANQNGMQGGSESGIDGIRVEMYKDNGDGIIDTAVDTFINFTLTANGGYYLFPNLPDGDYYSVFYKPPSMEFTTTDAGGNDAIDSDGVPNTINGLEVAITPIVTLDNFAYDLSWDLGLYSSTNGAIGNYIWSDLNSNGVQDEANTDGINGVTIYLYDNNNPTVPIDSVVTANDVNGDPGFYLFDDVPPGNYFLEMNLPSGTSYTTQGATGTSDPLDSDFSSTTNRTEVFAVTAGNYDNTWDGGLILSGVEICDNGIDDDGNGLTDCEDPACPLIVNPASLNACDYANETGVGSFFLFDANSTVTLELGVDITYHASLIDAQNNINKLVSPYSSSDGTVYVRVERIANGCFGTANITLDVGVKCVESCVNGVDDDGDGLIDCEDPDCPCCQGKY